MQDAALTWCLHKLTVLKLFTCESSCRHCHNPFGSGFSALDGFPSRGGDKKLLLLNVQQQTRKIQSEPLF